MYLSIYVSIYLVVETVEKKREPMPAMEAIYLITPNQNSVRCLMGDFQVSYFHVLSCTLMSSHVLSRTFMYFHVLSCTFMYFHILSCTFMYFHVPSCTFMHFYVLSCTSAGPNRF